MIKAKRHQQGFTLIELVMTAVILSVISIVIGKILFQGYRAFLTSQEIADADWQGLITLERIVNDIHQIRSASDITTAQTSQLAFTTVAGDSMQYQLSGSTLLRNSQTLASGISNLTFGYLDEDGSTTSTLTAIRYISISITAVQGNFSLTFPTMANIRGAI